MPVQPAVTPHTILLEGKLGEKMLEYYATATLYPGHILEVISTGKVQKFGTTLKTYPKLIALEDVLYNGRTINDAYAADDLVNVHVCQPGDLVYARVAAAATAITIGARLKKAADGTLAITTTAADDIFGYAEEALDNSAGGAEAFIRCRVA